MNISKVSVLVAGAAFACAAHAQSLLLNGSFELPVGHLNTYVQAAPTDWTCGSSVCFIGDFPTIFPAADGQQFVTIGAGSSGYDPYYLFQDFTVVNQGDCDLTWDDNLTSSVASEYTVSISEGAQTLVSQDRYPVYAAMAWAPQSIEFNLSPGSYTLEFQIQTSFALLDNVALVETVPEPTTLSLFTLMGLAGVLVIHRKK